MHEKLEDLPYPFPQMTISPYGLLFTRRVLIPLSCLEFLAGLDLSARLRNTLGLSSRLIDFQRGTFLLDISLFEARQCRFRPVLQDAYFPRNVFLLLHFLFSLVT